MKTIIMMLAAILVTGYTMAGEPKGHKLTVVIKNFENTDGQAMVSYFQSEDKFLKDGKGARTTINDKNEIKVVFENVQPGTLAVSVVHDENGNNELDKGVFGIPTEDYGFSNDAKGSFGPPSFEQCQFELNSDKTIEININ
ncbi:MAG: DUF2141 domain-containing protein [Cyclobacteriaceae bacterium]